MGWDSPLCVQITSGPTLSTSGSNDDDDDDDDDEHGADGGIRI
jgi:hypothetical protein